MRLAGGFDHCYCVRAHGKGRAGPLREVARVYDPGSGRQLQVSTTEAGLQFYSGNALGGVPGRGARPYARHHGFCLEAHAYPDQLNVPQIRLVDVLAVIVADPVAFGFAGKPLAMTSLPLSGTFHV